MDLEKIITTLCSIICAVTSILTYVNSNKK